MLKIIAAFEDLEDVEAHARSIICAVPVEVISTCLCCCCCCCCAIIAPLGPPSVSIGVNGMICLPASSIPPNIIGACLPDAAVAAVPPTKLVNAAVAAEPVAEATPLFPWFTEEATANWTTLSRAVPEAEQSAMVPGSRVVVAVMVVVDSGWGGRRDGNMLLLAPDTPVVTDRRVGGSLPPNIMFDQCVAAGGPHTQKQVGER